MANLTDKIKVLPDRPGAYLFKDNIGKVIYVGKAKSLKKRVSSYFQKGKTLDQKTKALKEKITDLDFFITPTEIEALILECNLIKEYRPRFNISYRDDKSYPYIAISVSDEFPRIYITREKHRRGRVYFGPYTRPGDVRRTIDSIRRVFPLRYCRGQEPGRGRNKPCLNYHINLCLGPCIGQVGKKEYRKIVKQVIKFLEGEEEEIINSFQKEMREASAKLDFEKAAKLRDKIKAAQAVIGYAGQRTKSYKDLDIIASAHDSKKALVTVLRVRDSRLIGSENFILNIGRDDLTDYYLSSFIKQYYSSLSYFPRNLVIEEKIEDQELIAQWLSQKRKGRVYLHVPVRGQKHKLVKLAQENADQVFRYQQLSAQEKDTERILKKLQKDFCLPYLPRRIEAFDISNISGQEAVGSMIVFTNNQPEKNFYRRFRIKSLNKPNDFEMMKEIIVRRLRYLNSEKTNIGFQIVPDLILIDGGKPQLSAGLAASKDVGIDEIPIIALAKKEEKVYLPESEEPLQLDKHSEALKLIQRIRDEAHRFALQYHRDLRRQKMTSSLLDQIPGIGSKRKAILLKEFSSLEKLSQASIKEIESIPGIPGNLARSIHKTFHR